MFLFIFEKYLSWQKFFLKASRCTCWTCMQSILNRFITPQKYNKKMLFLFFFAQLQLFLSLSSASVDAMKYCCFWKKRILTKMGICESFFPSFFNTHLFLRVPFFHCSLFTFAFFCCFLKNKEMFVCSSFQSFFYT